MATSRLTVDQLARWRRHREHCASIGTDNPCWGPTNCQQCIDEDRTTEEVGHER